MDLDDIKAAWHTLDARFARQERVQLELLRTQRLQQARRHLRPLLVGMALQAVLGVALILLGIHCWQRNPDVTGLLATGIALHAFGVAHVVFAGLVAALALGIDYASPVLTIQKRLRQLLRLQVLNSNACGAPWWIAWVLVVIAVAGLSPPHVGTHTPQWIQIGLGMGVVGTLATWWWSARMAHRPDALRAKLGDGADGIRRSLRVFDDLEGFERE